MPNCIPKIKSISRPNENSKQPLIVMSYCSNIKLSHIKSFEINTNICTHAAHIKENIHFSIFHKLAPCIILSAKNYRVLRTRKPQKWNIIFARTMAVGVRWQQKYETYKNCSTEWEMKIYNLVVAYWWDFRGIFCMHVVLFVCWGIFLYSHTCQQSYAIYVRNYFHEYRNNAA